MIHSSENKLSVAQLRKILLKIIKYKPKTFQFLIGIIVLDCIPKLAHRIRIAIHYASRN